MKIRLLIAALGATTAAAAAPLQIVTENNPPFNYAEGTEVKGVATAAVRELLAKAGVESTITVLKWDDAYKKAQTNANTCIFSTARVEAREKVFKWYGPIAENTWALYGLPTFDKKLATARDARFYKIGSVKNDAKVEFMRAEGASSIREAATDAENPKRLASAKTDPDHIDLWITTSATAKDVAEKAGVKDLKEVLVVKKQPLYLACNPRTDKATLDKLATASKK
jgi:polar amino acid transport system substrate-binding protein